MNKLKWRNPHKSYMHICKHMTTYSDSIMADCKSLERNCMTTYTTKFEKYYQNNTELFGYSIFSLPDSRYFSSSLCRVYVMRHQEPPIYSGRERDFGINHASRCCIENQIFNLVEIPHAPNCQNFIKYHSCTPNTFACAGNTDFNRKWVEKNSHKKSRRMTILTMVCDLKM